MLKLFSDPYPNSAFSSPFQCTYANNLMGKCFIGYIFVPENNFPVACEMYHDALLLLWRVFF